MQKYPPHLPHTRLALVFIVHMGGSFAKIVVANILCVRVFRGRMCEVNSVLAYYKKSLVGEGRNITCGRNGPPCVYE